MSTPSIEFYNKALDAIQAGQLPEALTAIESSLTEDPKDGQSWQLYAVILNAAGRADDAAKAMEKVKECGISDIDELLMKAGDAAAAGEHGKAITYYEDALEIDSSRFEIHASYALVLLEENYEKDARDAAETACDIAPEEAFAWYVRGRVLRLNHQPEEALKSLKKAVDLDANLLPAVYEKGMLLAEAGKAGEALSCFEKVLSVHPDDPAALEAKGALITAINQAKKDQS